jgi:hypothetical protein
VIATSDERTAYSAIHIALLRGPGLWDAPRRGMFLAAAVVSFAAVPFNHPSARDSLLPGSGTF